MCRSVAGGSRFTSLGGKVDFFVLCSFVVLSVVDRQYGYNTVGVVIYMY